MAVALGSASRQGAARSGCRLAGGAGIVGVALGTAAGIVTQIWRAPPTTSSPIEISSFVHSHRDALLAGMVLSSAAATLWMAFGAGVWVRLAGGGQRLFTACFAMGLVSLVTLLLGGFTAFFVLVYRAPDPSSARLLYDVTFGLLAMSGAPTALALAAYAAQVFATGGFARRTAWLAIIAAAAHVALLASFLVPRGFFSLEGAVIIVLPATLFVWIADTGFTMVRGDGSRA